jgi:serine/threonine protein kinase
VSPLITEQTSSLSERRCIQMATGTLPFQGGTPEEILDAILSKAPASPLQLKPSLPPKFARLISKALQKDRTARHQSAPRCGRTGTPEFRHSGPFGPGAGPRRYSHRRVDSYRECLVRDTFTGSHTGPDAHPADVGRRLDD